MKNNKFFAISIFSASILLILRIIAYLISLNVKDPIEAAHYYLFIMSIYLISLILLIWLYIFLKQLFDYNKKLGLFELLFLIVFTFYAFKTYKIVPAAIEYNSFFSDNVLNLLDEGFYAGEIAVTMTNEIFTYTNIWIAFGIIQIVVALIEKRFVKKDYDNSFLENDVNNTVKETKKYVYVNDMEIEITGELLFGSGSDCNIYLDNNFVSTYHGVIGLDEIGIYVRDLNSTNHSFVNGTQIKQMENHYLNPGDIVTFANIDIKIIEK